MGWNRFDTATGVGLHAGDYVYFAHSFACDDGPATAARADYGGPVVAAVREGHLWGAQFHPERSSAAGSRFLEAFLA
jgi:glutamine amidotransferase